MENPLSLLESGFSYKTAYATAQRSSKHPEKFGTGIIDGIVASESSNNASVGGAMVPLLTLLMPLLTRLRY